MRMYIQTDEQTDRQAGQTDRQTGKQRDHTKQRMLEYQLSPD